MAEDGSSTGFGKLRTNYAVHVGDRKWENEMKFP